MVSVVWLGSGRGDGDGLRAGLRDAVDGDRSFVAGSPGENGFPLSGYPSGPVFDGYGYATAVGYGGELGLLDPVWEPFVREAEYVIFSYETPVAWLSAGVWSVPEVHYSNTTARFVKAVRDAFGVVRVKPGL